jgi:hypothetical protein
MKFLHIQTIGVILGFLGFAMFFFGVAMFSYNGPVHPFVRSLGIFSFSFWFPIFFTGLILSFIRKKKLK